jgi:hypothetical protein
VGGERRGDHAPIMPVCERENAGAGKRHDRVEHKADEDQSERDPRPAGDQCGEREQDRGFSEGPRHRQRLRGLENLRAVGVREHAGEDQEKPNRAAFDELHRKDEHRRMRQRPARDAQQGRGSATGKG